MQQLLLLRHAKSAWDDPSQPDHARPLNARGRQAARAMRGVMRELNLLPDVVLVSSARRTLQTLEALAPWDEMPIIEPMNELYLATPERILRIIGGVAATVRSLMVVGHNPGMHELALRLAGAQTPRDESTQLLAEGFPAGALASFTVSSSWRTLAGGGPARLARFIRPRDLAPGGVAGDDPAEGDN